MRAWLPTTEWWPWSQNVERRRITWRRNKVSHPFWEGSNTGESKQHVTGMEQEQGTEDAQVLRSTNFRSAITSERRQMEKPAHTTESLLIALFSGPYTSLWSESLGELLRAYILGPISDFCLSRWHTGSKNVCTVLGTTLWKRLFALGLLWIHKGSTPLYLHWFFFFFWGGRSTVDQRWEWDMSQGLLVIQF